VADDNRDGAETMSMLLKLSGHDVYLAYSGSEALEVARRERPDIAVLDIGMPDLNERFSPLPSPAAYALASHHPQRVESAKAC
jgi:CheY-like chemotaxis protein